MPCVACNANGEAANAEQTACIRCDPGSQPAEDRSQCIQCTGREFSTYGFRCLDCPLGYEPNDFTGVDPACNTGACDVLVPSQVCVDIDECLSNNGGCDPISMSAVPPPRNVCTQQRLHSPAQSFPVECMCPCRPLCVETHKVRFDVATARQVCLCPPGSLLLLCCCCCSAAAAAAAAPHHIGMALHRNLP
eukprot:SAG11_NODE_6449_length_1311_cov_1.247525_1_plen_191_part_00